MVLVNMSNNVGGLFQYLNSEACNAYYAELTPENRGAVVEHMMTECPEFLEAAQALVSDTAVIRQKLETKIGQMCKKMGAVPKDVPKDVPLPKANVELVEASPPPEANVVVPEFDEEKGHYIGGGFYLKREDHLMKLTSPEWTIYY